MEKSTDDRITKWVRIVAVRYHKQIINIKTEKFPKDCCFRSCFVRVLWTLFACRRKCLFYNVNFIKKRIYIQLFLRFPQHKILPSAFAQQQWLSFCHVSFFDDGLFAFQSGIVSASPHHSKATSVAYGTNIIFLCACVRGNMNIWHTALANRLYIIHIVLIFTSRTLKTPRFSCIFD